MTRRSLLLALFCVACAPAPPPLPRWDVTPWGR